MRWASPLVSVPLRTATLVLARLAAAELAVEGCLACDEAACLVAAWCASEVLAAPLCAADPPPRPTTASITAATATSAATAITTLTLPDERLGSRARRRRAASAPTRPRRPRSPPTVGAGAAARRAQVEATGARMQRQRRLGQPASEAR